MIITERAFTTPLQMAACRAIASWLFQQHAQHPAAPVILSKLRM
jgi:hypothetical protein